MFDRADSDDSETVSRAELDELKAKMARFTGGKTKD